MKMMPNWVPLTGQSGSGQDYPPVIHIVGWTNNEAKAHYPEVPSFRVWPSFGSIVCFCRPPTITLASFQHCLRSAAY